MICARCEQKIRRYSVRTKLVVIGVMLLAAVTADLVLRRCPEATVILSDGPSCGEVRP
jgi:hypothetical protein